MRRSRRLGELLKVSKLHGLTLKGAADLAEKWEARACLKGSRQRRAASPEVLGGDVNKRDPGAEGKEAALRALVGWDAEMPATM